MTGREILEKLVEAGTVYYDGSQIVGQARDGVEVLLGFKEFPEETYRYLESHPTPDTW